MFGSGCESAKDREEARRVACLNTICPEDREPPHDYATETLFKINGHLFVVPRSYAAGMSSIAFYWPSKNAITASGDAERGKPFYDVAVEVFLRAPPGPQLEPSGYAMLQLAESEGKLVSKASPRAGVETWRLREDDGLHVAYYVALEEEDRDGYPPVLGCREEDPAEDRCFAAFLWQPDIAADLRFRAVHALDWPEIYRETLRILSEFKRVEL
jgi:hypothetical protein